MLDLAAAGFTVRRILDVIPEDDAQVSAALLALIERGVLLPLELISRPSRPAHAGVAPEARVVALRMVEVVVEAAALAPAASRDSITSCATSARLRSSIRFGVMRKFQ